MTTGSRNHGHGKWAPGGGRIIFNATLDPAATNEEVYEMNLDGSDVRKLTDHPLRDTYASISPDGARIAFRRVIVAPGFDGGLRLIAQNSESFSAGRDGSNPVNLTNSAAFDGWPDWSRDSEWIAFSSNRTGDFHVFVMRRDGTGIRQVTTAAGSFTKPIWSPDGRQIVCTRTLDGNVEVFIINVGVLSQR